MDFDFEISRADCVALRQTCLLIFYSDLQASGSGHQSTRPHNIMHAVLSVFEDSDALAL